MKTIIFLALIMISISACKRGDEQLYEDIAEGGNYLLIEDEKFDLDSLSVTYQNVESNKVFQVMAFNKGRGVFVALQYFILEAEDELPSGEFSYQKSNDLRNIQAGHFYNVVVKLDSAAGEKIIFDGLAGDPIEKGVFKIKKEKTDQELSGNFQIAGKHIELHYIGKVTCEEFEW